MGSLWTSSQLGNATGTLRTREYNALGRVAHGALLMLVELVEIEAMVEYA